MNQPLFIESAVAISPQDSFRPELFLKAVRHTDRGWHSLVDAPYQDYIGPVAIRRMSRILKVGISAAMAALRESGVASPDAIITGTGRGVVTDMEQFVKDMDRLKEATLNPTLFIQSTYNSANGWIAMQSKCQGYNQTYVHRGISFELALQDAMMLAAESSGSACILCGCFDEMTPEHYHIHGKLGNWRAQPGNSLHLYETGAAGTIAGEGSAFFTLCRTRTHAASEVLAMRILYNPDGAGVKESCHEVLRAAGLDWEDVDLLLSGYNGDNRSASFYAPVHAAAAAGGGHAFFKHLVGEYNTASGFGLWLADWIIKRQELPNVLNHNGNARPLVRNVLLVNGYREETASVILVRAAGSLTVQ